MANETRKPVMPNQSRTNPSVDPRTGRVNPSAPTAGTENWGNTSDERRTLSDTEPSGTLAGSSTAGKSQSKHDSPSHDTQSDFQSTMSHGQKTGFGMGQGGNDQTFRCADVGSKECQWQTSGSTDEILRKTRDHARTEHGMKDWTAAMDEKVRNAIHSRRAA